MALFDGNIDEFRKIVPGLTINFSLENVLPTIQQTEDSLYARFLGDTLAIQFAELYGDEAPPITDRYLKRALYLLQIAAGRIGFAEYLPFGEVQIGDDGATIPNAGDRKAAFAYQTKAIRMSLQESGWRALDELISLVASKPQQFPGWSDSPLHEWYQNAIFKSAADFSKSYPIQDKWLTFWALHPFIQSVEENRGTDALERINALEVSGSLKARLTRGLKRALAYQAVLEGMPSLSIELNGANIQINYAGQFASVDYYQPPSKDDLSWVMDNLQKQMDLAWSTFEADLSALENPEPETPTTTQTGLIYSTGAATML